MRAPGVRAGPVAGPLRQRCRLEVGQAKTERSLTPEGYRLASVGAADSRQDQLRLHAVRNGQSGPDIEDHLLGGPDPRVPDFSRLQLFQVSGLGVDRSRRV